MIQFPFEVLHHPKSVVTENLPKRVSVEGSKLTTSMLGMAGLTVTGSEPVCILKQIKRLEEKSNHSLFSKQKMALFFTLLHSIYM
jgi:hypothetical protein